MATGLNAYMGQNSKHATREQKRAVLDTIISAGNDGIIAADIRARTGLDDASQRLVMLNLRQYGAIRVLRKDYRNGEPYNVWGAI